MKDIISVNICAYNAENTLEKAVTSVLDNITVDDNGVELFDIQLVLMDDGSKDSTWEIIERIQKSDSRVIAVHQENTGIAGAREASLEYMSGRYFTFCDSDDWVEPDWLVSMYRAIKKYDADIVRFRAIMEGKVRNNNPEVISVWSSSDAIREFFVHKKINALLTLCLFDSSIFRDVHFDTSLRVWVDQGVMLKLLYNARKVVVVNDAKYHYIVNSKGVCNSRPTIRRVKSSMYVMDGHVNFCKNNGLPEFVEAAERMRRRWMLAELKSMYKYKLHDDIETSILSLYKKEYFKKAISEFKAADKVFVSMAVICPGLTRSIVEKVFK